MKNAWTEEIDRLREVNRELLEACKSAAALLSGLNREDGNVYDDLKSAIAKAEEGRE